MQLWPKSQAHFAARVARDSCQRISAASSNANSVNFRNKDECAAIMFFFPASSRYGNGSCANPRKIFAATPLSKRPLPNTKGTGMDAKASLSTSDSSASLESFWDQIARKATRL